MLLPPVCQSGSQACIAHCLTKAGQSNDRAGGRLDNDNDDNWWKLTRSDDNNDDDNDNDNDNDGDDNDDDDDQ